MEFSVVTIEVASGVIPDMTWNMGWKTDEWPSVIKRIIEADILN